MYVKVCAQPREERLWNMVAVSRSNMRYYLNIADNAVFLNEMDTAISAMKDFLYNAGMFLIAGRALRLFRNAGSETERDEIYKEMTEIFEGADVPVSDA